MTTVRDVCTTCGGDGVASVEGRSEDYGFEPCPACRGTKDAGVPVILPADIAEHLPALLRPALVTPAHCGPVPWPVFETLIAWLEAQG